MQQSARLEVDDGRILGRVREFEQPFGSVGQDHPVVLVPLGFEFDERCLDTVVRQNERAHPSGEAG